MDSKCQEIFLRHPANIAGQLRQKQCENKLVLLLSYVIIFIISHRVLYISKEATCDQYHAAQRVQGPPNGDQSAEPTSISPRSSAARSRPNSVLISKR